MTSLQDLDLNEIKLTEEMCTQVINAIVANSDHNPALSKINIYQIGGYHNKKWVKPAAEKIAYLRAKGVEVIEEE